MANYAINRRSLLLSAGIPLAATVVARAGESKTVRSLLAEGVAQVDTVLGQQPLQLPPAILAALQSGSQIRVRIVYPDRRGLATFYGFVAAPTDPPAPLPSLSVDDPRVFTVLRFEIDEKAVHFYPEPTFTLLGRVAEETRPSPFFPGLTGRVCGITAAFQNEGITTFSMLGGFVSGSHASYARTAVGVIDL